MCSAVLLAVALFEFLVWDTLDSANNMITEVKATWVDSNHTTTHINMLFHSIVIQIISLYLQIASMLLQFDLQLPPSVRALIVVEASTSSLSESLLSIDCATSVRNDAGLFLMKQLASVWGIPLCAMVVCGVFWWVAHTCVLGRNKSKMTGLDGFLSSLMVLFYTLFPSMVSHIVLMFSCKNYGHGVHTKSLLTGSGCGIVGVTATLDGGVVVQFDTRPRRRRQQQSFGSIWVTKVVWSLCNDTCYVYGQSMFLTVPVFHLDTSW